MEPVTHFLTGAVLGRAGLNRKTAYATLAAVLAAEAADLDVFWGVAGPVENLKHHRGWTHTFWGAFVVAAVVVAAIGCWHAWRSRRAKPAQNAQPIRWGWLFLAALLSSLVHLFLDWTNTYGLRPFFPFNPRWYAGGFVFIYEPILWAILLLALLAPALGGLIAGEIGERRKPFRGRGWALFALCAMAALWGWRWSEQGRARNLLEANPVSNAPVSRTMLLPRPVNPFRWNAVQETPDAYQFASIDTRRVLVESDPLSGRVYKPVRTPAVEAAMGTLLGRVYLDWGTWAVVRDLGPVPIAGLEPPQLPPGRSWTTIEFTDMRFGPAGAGRAPLGGWVYIVDGREEAGMILGGHVQK